MPSVIEQGMLQYIQNCRVEDLSNAIKNNLSLKEIILQMVPPHIIELAKLVTNSNSLSAETMRACISQNRPDLAEVLNTSEGSMWLERQVIEIKEVF